MTKPKPKSALKKPVTPKPVVTKPTAIPVDAIHQSASRAILIVAILGLAVFIAWTEYHRGRSSEPVDPTPVATVDVTSTWTEIAAQVEAGRIGSTGELLSIVKVLDLDLTRLKSLVDKPVAITDKNRDEIVALCEGR